MNNLLLHQFHKNLYKSVAMKNNSEGQPPSIAYIHTSEPEQHRTSPLYAMHPASMTTIKEISCGYNFSLLLDANMRVYSFGGNEHGQLGYDSQMATVSEIRPININKNFIIEGIRCGFTHAVVFGKRESYGWGEHQYGALGYEPIQVINSWMPRKIPILISSHQQLLEVSCGNNTTIFNISNKFYCLGDNRLGQLGLILKKPSFEPEKIQIQNTKFPRQSKLISIKAGDGFTVGMDDNHQLFGAGQVAKLGLAIRNKNILPTGLSELELTTKNGYQMLVNVEEYDCRQSLVVKFMDDQGDYWTVFGQKNGPLSKTLDKNIKIVGQTNQCLLLQEAQNLYKWRLHGNNRNQIENLRVFSEKEVKLDRIGCEGCGRVIVIDNNPSSSSQARFNWKAGSQTQRISPSQNVKKVSQALNSCQNFQKQSLQKQIKEQNEIIRLFEQYVSKLQTENMELKQQLRRSSPRFEEEKDDNITNGLTMLKVVLKDMLQQYTQRCDK